MSIADRPVSEETDPVPSKRTNWKRLGIAAVAVAFGLAMIPVLIVSAAYSYYFATDLIMPGVQVGGIPLEGLTLQQASAVMDLVWNVEVRIQAIDLTDASPYWEFAPSEIGLRVDANASAQLAHAHGRDAGLIHSVRQMIDGWFNGCALQPYVTFDSNIALQAIETWADVLHIPATNADLIVQDGESIQVAAQEGRSLDVEATLGLLAADPTSVLLKYRFVPLVMKPVEPTIGDVDQAASEAERLIASQPSLQAFDPVTGELITWTPTRTEIASWLQIERTPAEVHVHLDSQRLSDYVQSLNASLGAERSFDLEAANTAVMQELQGEDSETLLIRYQPRSYVIQRGDSLITISLKYGIPYWKLREYNPGMVFATGVTMVIPPKDAMLSIPVVMNKRIVISISQQRMWLYQDGEMIDNHVVSTGIPSSPTMAGIFQITSHVLNAYASRWDLYMPHFLGIYEATPYLENGIHGLPLLSSGVRLWASVLGQPASYGCIILDLQAAEQVYNWADDGVVVEIQR
ncbi:MAG TPA: L,D-transpeptidase family protein [Anaerolineae bacterium]|nr:L,D-transpeptidase family protein [Anaerolineae bacterium]